MDLVGPAGLLGGEEEGAPGRGQLPGLRQARSAIHGGTAEILQPVAEVELRLPRSR
jgi:hypothetical protein